jgi:hypothetical protein
MPDSGGQSIFRRSPSVNIGGRNLTDARYKTRYNAYVNIKSSLGGTLPQPGTTFDDTYSTGKPGVVLNSVTIYEGQEFGSLLQAEVQFTCFTKAKFDALSKQFLTLRSGDKPVTVDIDFGLVGAPFSNSAGSVKKLMIYNFGYQLDKSNAYVCTFKAMGSAVLANEVDMSANNRIPDLGVTYLDPAENGAQPIPVTTLPEYVKYLAQSNGAVETVQIEPGVFPQAPAGYILVADHPGNWNPESEIGKAIYSILQSMGLAGSDDSSKLIYGTLDLVVGLINDYIMPRAGEMAKIRYVCDSTVTTGAYLSGICSAEPLNILMVGGDIGDYGVNSGLDIDECLISSAIPGMINPLAGDTYDYSKIFLSYSYLASKWAVISNTKNTAEGAKDPNDKPAQTKFNVGSMLKGIFEDISNATGGAVKLTTFTDPKNPSQVLIIPSNESSNTLKPVRFDPLNGDGITRECVISCNPASADAYAIAAGNSSMQSSTVEATGGSASPAEDLGAIQAKIIELRDAMAKDTFGSAQVAALRDQLSKLTHACGSKEVTDGKIPITAAQWPLKLDITLDGVYGFRFGDVVETTFLPDVYLKGGIHAGFIVQRVVHTITNNEWTTKLETVCDLIKT